MSAPELHKAGVLRDLPPRRDPHWGPPLARGRHVGYRKIDQARGTWIARFRGEDGKMRFQSLGLATPEFGYDAAKVAARQWFATQEGCPVAAKGAYTVADACRDLVAARKAAYEADLTARGAEPFPGELPAWKDAEGRFQRTVYNNEAFAAKPLSKLTSADLTTWLEGLKQTESTQNRNLAALKAALNRAAEKTQSLAHLITVARKVKKHRTGEPTRKLPFLDLEQRRAFLAMSGEGDFRDFVLAHMLTGARCGELARLKRRNFDARTKSVTFSGKTGPRTVPLAQDAVALFARRALQASPGEASLLFTNSGKAWVNGDWCELTRGVVRAAKSPSNTSLYALRHSWITQSLLDGIPPLLVAKLAGTSLEMIQRHYGHLVVERARDELNSVKYC